MIEGLLAVQNLKVGDNVYACLEVMCRSCAGKPLVYYSRYRPRPAPVRHRAQARRQDGLVERHRTSRQLWLAESQWEALKERLAAARTGRRA